MNLIESNSKIVPTGIKNLDYLEKETLVSIKMGAKRQIAFQVKYFKWEHLIKNKPCEICKGKKDTKAWPTKSEVMIHEVFSAEGYVRINFNIDENKKHWAMFIRIINAVRKKEKHGKVICDRCI